MDLRDSVRGGYPGLIPPASLPESDYSQRTAQLRDASHMMSSEEDKVEVFKRKQASSCKLFLVFT